MGLVLDKIRSFDSYGQPVSVNYKGNDTYQTVTGGLISLLAAMIVAIFAIVKGMDLLNLDNPNISSITEFQAYQTTDDELYLRDYLIDPVIEFRAYGYNEGEEFRTWDALDDRYGRIIF